MHIAEAMTLEQHGAARHHRAALDVLADLQAVLGAYNDLRGGVRISGNEPLTSILTADPIVRIAHAAIGRAARPIRAVVFDKTADRNWSLGWHQDRTIVVRSRIDTPGFDHWTVKRGLQHVEPPFNMLAAMLTIRIHLDPVDDDNAPLLVAPGSHRFGRISEPDIAATVDRCGVVSCHAEAGDVWAYATPILHASAASQRVGRRRVLQVDYSAEQLPDGLEWQGI